MHIIEILNEAKQQLQELQEEIKNFKQEGGWLYYSQLPFSIEPLSSFISSV
jgi:DNA polymerase IIIc chi subunit